MKNSITILFLLCIIPQVMFSQFGVPITLDATNTIVSELGAKIINGNPAVVYIDNFFGKLFYIRSNNSNGTSWPSNPININAPNGQEGNISLETVNGNPAFSYFHYDQTNDVYRLYFVRANDANGTVWNSAVEAATSTFSGDLEVAFLDGKPSIFFYNSMDNVLKYVRAVDANGTSWGPPVTINLNASEFDIHLVQGNPAMAFVNNSNQQIEYVRAVDVSGTNWGTPTTLSNLPNSTFLYPKLKIIDGKPGISVYDFTGNGLLFSIHATDNLGTNWQPAPVQVLSGFTQTPGAGIGHDLEFINGRPAIVYFEQHHKNLRFIPAITSDGLLWDPVTYLLDATPSTTNGLGIAMVKMSNGLPGVFYIDDTPGDLKFVSATANIPPSNDSVCEAYEMQTVVPTTYNMNNLVATTQANEAQPNTLANCNNQYSWCQNTTIAKTLWYKFVAPTSGSVEIITTNNDTNIALYEASDCTSLLNGNYTLLAANDDFFGIDGSKIEDYRCLNPGDTYYVQVNGTDADGNFGLLINPLNETCDVVAFLESCGSGVINPPNPNWHGQINYIKNDFGEIYAAIIDNGNDLGNVTVDFEFVNTFRGSGTQTYSGKTWTITPTNQPTTNVTLRLYILDIEFNDMKTNNPNINSIDDLHLRRVSGGSCGNYAGGGDVFAPVSATTFNGSHYCLEYSIPGFSSFYLQGGAGALPVELTKFEGVEAGNFNLLKWETVSEINTKSFEIERSLDGLDNWNTIGTIGAAGNSTETQSYQFTDRQPLTKAYYRLRSVDFDEESEVSHTIYIERKSEASFEIFPNPANDVLYLNFKEDNYKNGNVSIFDLNGKLVQQSLLNYSNNKLNINDLQKGIYFIEIKGEGQILRKRFLKQ